MAKVRRLIKTLEAEGWEPALKREDFTLWRHPERPQRLTLPSYKCSIPEGLAQQVAAIAGITLRAE
ncbi:MAG: hypothetical protein EAZ99_15820 [Alphaproteobacteria bacterium]|nr:hypothetical protein [Alphaproteobacteria bacterium]TAD87869.1 MAG: hypothetical protein EAZ99_15820 [Alphaproteobacteria bacterium]